MKRRTFLSLIGLSFFTTISLMAIVTMVEPETFDSTSSFLSKGLKPLLFYVAPNGNDNWSGKYQSPTTNQQDGPFATIHRARDAIRELKHQQGGTLKQPVTVFLRGGTYYLSNPLTFVSEDSGTVEFPITYKAYPKEKPIISGGKPITDWRKQGNLWVAKLPEVKTGQWYFRSLRVNDEWAIRARYPKFDSDNPLTGGWLYTKHPKAFARKKGEFNSSVGRIHNRGDKLQWDIEVPSSGEYHVWLRYGNNMKAYGVENMGNRTALGFNNDVSVVLPDLPDTGNFKNFRWQLVTTVDLLPGRQKLEWENIKGGGLNLDAFCLTNDRDWNPDDAISINKNEAKIQSPKSGKHFILVHAETFVNAIGKDIAILPEKPIRDRLTVTSEQFPNWQNWQDAEVHVFPYRGWVNAILPITSLDRQSNTIHVRSKHNIEPGNRFFIANVREALTTPGEWYLDKNQGELIYWAKSSNFPNNTEIIAPKIDKLIVLEGNPSKRQYVQYLSFQGLTFTDTRYSLTDNYYISADAAIWLSTTRKCTIEDCNFVRLGGYGVRIERKSHGNHITKNTMSYLGQGGIILLGDTANQPFNNLIAGNEIHDCGQVYKHVAGVYIISGSNNRIAHNHIYRMPRYGVSLKSLGDKRYSHNNAIEFNKIIDTNLETSDTGAIETLGRDKQISGNVIRYNLIRNVVGMGTKGNSEIISPYYTWGIYLDDYSSGTKVYGNIIVGTVLGGICIHSGKDNRIENNIFIDGSEMQIRLQPRDDFMTGNIFSNNIIVYKNPKALLWYSYKKHWRQKDTVISDRNLYWHTGNLNLATTRKAITPEGNWQEWQDAGFDNNSLIGDPLFIDPDKDIFRVNSNSPAWKIGFKSIPINSIGIEGFKA